MSMAGMKLRYRMDLEGKVRIRERNSLYRRQLCLLSSGSIKKSVMTSHRRTVLLDDSPKKSYSQLSKQMSRC
jgi:hypothetical protein